MLELDLILAPFVENVYDSLTEDDQLRFEVVVGVRRSDPVYVVHAARAANRSQHAKDIADNP